MWNPGVRMLWRRRLADDVWGSITYPVFTKEMRGGQGYVYKMDAAYVAGLDKYGTIWLFVVVLVLSVVMAAVSERISERILKIME